MRKVIALQFILCYGTQPTNNSICMTITFLLFGKNLESPTLNDNAKLLTHALKYEQSNERHDPLHRRYLYFKINLVIAHKCTGSAVTKSTGETTLNKRTFRANMKRKESVLTRFTKYQYLCHECTDHSISTLSLKLNIMLSNTLME